MTQEPRTWADLVADLRCAREAGDFDRGEDILAWMQRESAHQGDLLLEASVLFHEGILADAKGELGRAERCFIHTVELDRRIHGEVSVEVAAALHSLAIVQSARGQHGAAAESSIAAAEIHVELGTAERVPALTHAAQALGRAGHADEAHETYLRVLRHPAPAGAPWRKNAALQLERYLVERRRYPEALGVVASGLRAPVDGTSACREAHAELLVALGHLSWTFGHDAQCHAAHRAALRYTEREALRAEAERSLGQVNAGHALDGPLDAYRVVFAAHDPNVVHVLHAEHGFFMTRDVPDARIGDTLERDPDRDTFWLATSVPDRPG